MTHLDESIMDADTQAADINIDLRRFVLADDLIDPVSDLHGIEATTTFDFRNAATLPPSDRGKSAGRISINLSRSF